MISKITIGGKTFTAELLSITVSCPVEFYIGDKVTASWKHEKETWEVTGFITLVEKEALWLNDIKFPKAHCNFKLA